MRLACLAAASAVVVLGGCAANPSAGGRYWNLDQCADSPSETVYMNRPDGTRVASIPRQTCIALRAASQKMEAEAGYRLSRIYLADAETPNAFATRDKSGNPIAVVTLGMLKAIGPDEPAWAGLLGHEIAHHVRRHSEGRAGAATTASLAGNVLANVISYSIPGVGGLLGGTVAGTAAQNAMYGAYTRPQEAEADELGLKWMVAAGYDPRGMSRLFGALARGSSASMPAFLSTHPANADRAQMVEAYLSSPDYSPPKPLAVRGGTPMPSLDCRDATSEIRIKTVCLTSDGCDQQVQDIKRFCGSAIKSSCSGAHEQLPAFCNRTSKTYSDKNCDVAASQVRAYCLD